MAAKVKDVVDKEAQALPGLDEEERELLESIERDEWQSVPNVQGEVKRLQGYARAAVEKSRKTKRVNLRISEGDLITLKTRAEEEGLPYQTLMASVLHKYATGRLAETGTRKS